MKQRKPGQSALSGQDQTPERSATGYGLCPGQEKCGGCYSVGVIDGRERFIHPPKGCKKSHLQNLNG